jgi:TRAP-type C4-dicarboxylate transport system permease large subunit
VIAVRRPSGCAGISVVAAFLLIVIDVSIRIAGMLKWATSFEVSRLVVLAVMFVVLILLGLFMDGVSMMLITVPIFFPLAQALGFDLIWFGMCVLITLEMAVTTPPFGLLL